MHKTEVKPLTVWYCDDCGKPINSIEEGWVEWWTELVTVTSSQDWYMDQLSAKAAQRVYEFEDDCYGDMEEPRFIINHSFRIIHYGPYSPRKPFSACYKLLYEEEKYRGIRHAPLLNDCSLSMLIDDTLPLWKKDDSAIMGDMTEYLDFERRLTVPYYEEARRYLKEDIRETL